MLLKIEAYPSGTTLEGWQPQPLHVCLATASNDGVALAVGRKEGLVIFDKDKSVSRKDHCVFRFVSTKHEEHVTVCQTPEETDAVDPIHNLALVVENNGKLGTVVVHEPEQNESAVDRAPSKKDDDDDSATTASVATAQEHAASQMSSGGALLSPVGRQIVGEEAASRVRLELLGAGAKRVLKPLRHEKGRVIVQCGKFGSTIIITRVETISILRSGIHKREKFVKLDWFGARELDEWREEQPISMLITKKKISNTKILSAFSQGKPIVTPAFLEAFAARTNGSDPLPQTKDFLAPAGDNAAFWNIQPDPQLLKGSTFIATKQNEDAELLVRCAGASIFHLFESGDPEQDVKELMEKSPCFALDASRRKLSTLVKKLGVPAVTAKAFAKCVTEQDPGQIDQSLLTALQERKAAAGKDDSTIMYERSVYALASSRVEPDQRDNDATETNEQGMVEALTDFSKSIHQEVDATGASLQDIDISTSQSSNKRIRVDDSTKNMNVSQDFEKEDTVSRQRKKARNSQQTSQWFGGDTLSQTQADKLNSSSNDDENLNERKSSAGQTNSIDTDSPDNDNSTTKSKRRSEGRPRLSSSGGWMQVAPKNDSKRKAMLPSEEEIKEIAGYEIMLPQAKTKKIAGLVGPAVGQKSFCRSNKQETRDNIPDFKAFRKNRVAQLPSGRTGNHPTYRLRSVRHKDSAVEQNQYDEQRQALEEQQRRADALFRDSGVRTKNRRR